MASIFVCRSRGRPPPRRRDSRSGRSRPCPLSSRRCRGDFEARQLLAPQRHGQFTAAMLGPHRRRRRCRAVDQPGADSFAAASLPRRDLPFLIASSDVASARRPTCGRSTEPPTDGAPVRSRPFFTVMNSNGTPASRRRLRERRLVALSVRHTRAHSSMPPLSVDSAPPLLSRRAGDLHVVPKPNHAACRASSPPPCAPRSRLIGVLEDRSPAAADSRRMYIPAPHVLEQRLQDGDMAAGGSPRGRAGLRRGRVQPRPLPSVGAGASRATIGVDPEREFER